VNDRDNGFWIQDKEGLWWQLMPAGPYPEPRELSQEERATAAWSYMRSKLAPKVDQIYVQAGMYETYIRNSPEDYSDGMT